MKAKTQQPDSCHCHSNCEGAYGGRRIDNAIIACLCYPMTCEHCFPVSRDSKKTRSAEEDKGWEESFDGKWKDWFIRHEAVLEGNMIKEDIAMHIGFACSEAKKEEKIDHSIDVRYEKDVIVAFDKFIKKWCGNNYSHLIDNDQNDGEYMREKIAQAKKEVLREVEKKGKQKEKELIQIIYFLAGCYQENFETFYGNPALTDAYMKFATIQGFSSRMLVKKLSEGKIDQKLLNKAMDDLEEKYKV